MKYTIQHGVERQFSERVNSNLHFILPLLVILAGVTFFLVNAQNSDRKPTKPLTLGIYTINSPDENKKDNPNGNTTNPDGDNGATNPPALISVSELDTLAAAGSPGAVSNALPVGGRGAGDVQGSVTPPPIAVAPSPVTTIATIGCSDISATPLICAVCSSPISITVGQKVLLAADGSCYAVDP